LYAVLHRYYLDENITLGRLMYGGHTKAVIERPDLDNARNISCIPAGEYDCYYLERSGSGRYKGVYHIQNVKDRSGILMHAGNFVEHSKGCLILGTKHGMLGGKRAVIQSRSAVKHLRDHFNNERFKLLVIGER